MDLQYLDCRGMIFDPKEDGFLKSFKDLIPGISGRKLVIVKKSRKEEGGDESIVIKDIHLFRYISLMYDPKSPMVRDVSDYWQRKLECIEASGFKIKSDGTLEKSTEDLVLGRVDVVNDCIIDFLAYVKSPTWSALIFMYETLLQHTKESLETSTSPSTKSEDVYKISLRIQDLMTKFLGEQMTEETSSFKKRLMARVEEKRLGIRPEDFAERLAKGDDLMDGSPYKNYVPTRIKFHGDKV